MILADKICMLRKKAGWSQEELAEQLNVTRQSVSKWEGAQSVPDIDKILQMSYLFGVTTDYLLKEEMEEEEPLAPDTKPNFRRVTMKEAEEYLSLSKAAAPKKALGTLFYCISPVVLLMLGAMSELSSLHISENMAGGIGIVMVLGFAAAGTVLYLSCSAKVKDYEFLDREPFETAYGVKDMVRERRKAYQVTHSRFHIIGTVLCILSPIPLFVLACMEVPDLFLVAALCLLLVFVGIGAAAFVYSNAYQEALNRLLEEDDYTRKRKEQKGVKGTISMIYWLAVTAIFLYYTFGPNGNGQGRYSWFIWAIAGVLFGAVMGIVSLIQNRKREK